MNQTQPDPPETRLDQDFTQRDIEPVSAKKKLKQDQSSPPRQIQMLTETKRSKGEVGSSQISNQSKNSEPDGNQDPSKRKAEEKEMVMKQQQQKHESSPKSESNQIQQPLETKPAI